MMQGFMSKLGRGATMMTKGIGGIGPSKSAAAEMTSTSSTKKKKKFGQALMGMSKRMKNARVSPSRSNH